MSKIGASIIRGLEQAIAFADGTGDPSSYVVHIPPEIDVRAIRSRLGMTQQQFAVSWPKTMRMKWHQPGKQHARY